jgi:hypothetical protein
MADIGSVTPLGQMAQPPNALGTLNDIVGLQQKRQGLVQQAQNIQTGKYLQATAKAESEQATLSNEAMQRTQSAMVQKAQSGGYTDPDGNFDGVAASNDALRLGGVYVADKANLLVSNAHEITNNKRDLQSLNADQQKQLGTRLQALANTKVDATGKSTLTQTDVINELYAMAQQNPQLTRMAISTAAHIPANSSSEDLKDLVNKYGQSVMTPGEAASISLPGQATNAASQLVNRGAYRGNVALPPGGGGNGNVNPTSSEVAEETQRTSKGALNDEDLYNNITRTAGNVGEIRGQVQEINALANEIKSGNFAEKYGRKWAEIQQWAGAEPGPMDQTTRRMILSKYIEQLAIKQEIAGGATTDAAQAHVRAALPNLTTMSPEAIKQATEYIGGQNDANEARAQLAISHRQNHGGNSNGLRAVDTAFQKVNDPRIHVYEGLPAGDARKDYVRRLFGKDPDKQQKIADFNAMISVYEHMKAK